MLCCSREAMSTLLEASTISKEDELLVMASLVQQQQQQQQHDALLAYDPQQQQHDALLASDPLAPPISVSRKCARTFNPIRAITDTLRPPVNHPKPLLNLSLGDPCHHGILPPAVLLDALRERIEAADANGYLPSSGSSAAKRAIAQYSSQPGFQCCEEDVIITSGCSGAIELVVSCLLDEGDNILVPCPGFPLYTVIANSLGGSTRPYPLLPERGWECDLEAMERLIDSRTRCIVICNPSNPTGTLFSSEHLEAIACVARRNHLPIVADEIYEETVFKGSMHKAHVYAGDVPVISLGGLAKGFCVPGWRVGWLVLHDHQGTGRLAAVRKGLNSLTQLILGANSLIQAVIPSVLTPVAGSAEEASLREFSSKYLTLLRNNAALCASSARECPLLKIEVQPAGALYVLLKLDLDSLHGVENDTDFCRLVLEEENLTLLPGSVFRLPNYIRIVTCASSESLVEGFRRIGAFVARRSISEGAGGGGGVGGEFS